MAEIISTDDLLSVRCDSTTKRAFEIFAAENGFSKKELLQKALLVLIPESIIVRAREAIEREAAANGNN